MYRPLESRFKEQTPRQRFEMLHERGKIEIFHVVEDAESVTFHFIKTPPPPVLSGWRYAISFYGDYAREAAEEQVSMNKSQPWKTMARRVPSWEGEQWDVFFSLEREGQNASI